MGEGVLQTATLSAVHLFLKQYKCSAQWGNPESEPRPVPGMRQALRITLQTAAGTTPRGPCGVRQRVLTITGAVCDTGSLPTQSPGRGMGDTNQHWDFSAPCGWIT